MSGQLEFAILIEDALVSALSVELEKFEGLRIASTTPVTPEQLERYRIKSDQLGLKEIVVAGSLLIAAGVVEHFILQDQEAAHVVIDATQSPPTIRTVTTLGSTDSLTIISLKDGVRTPDKTLLKRDGNLLSSVQKVLVGVFGGERVQ